MGCSDIDYSCLGKEVPIKSIDKELRLLWEADEATTKASLINFVIFSEGQDALLENSVAVAEITREHSCRAILLDLDRDCEGTETRSWITAHCNLSGGKKAVCCEQLAFKISGHADGIVRHTLFAHLDSDLPLVIWWQGNLTSTYKESFYSNVDRLIFDSSSWTEPKEEFLKLTQSLEKVPSLVVQDLAWTRTYHTRLALAALFDHPVAIAQLKNLSDVKVTVNRANRTSGLQLLAWVASLAEYKISPDLIEDTSSDCHTFVKPSGGELKMSVEYSDEYKAVGKVELSMGECELSLTREADRQLLLQNLVYNGETLVERHCPADAISDVGVISDQLSRGGKNSLFKRVLPQFLELL